MHPTILKIMKYFTFTLVFTFFITRSFSQTLFPEVVFETNLGKMVFVLYDETPLHCENFTKLVNEGYYNNQLFHRVIKNFMIQAGDPGSRNAQPFQMLGRGGTDYTIPAEFIASYFHKRGALAAARQPDNVNPTRESSGSQFYIVQGRVFSVSELNAMVQQGIHFPFTMEQKEIYTTIGGSPHLDYQYTVFGEPVQGFEVLDKIANSPVDRNNCPLTDIRIQKVSFLK